MNMDKRDELLHIAPVLPSQDIERDISWYSKYVGFEVVHKNEMYAVLNRDTHFIHLQWHADTDDDPLLGGSVIKVFVASIEPLFHEFLNRGTIKQDKLRRSTAWNTHEFGFYDPNGNAIFFVESL